MKLQNTLLAAAITAAMSAPTLAADTMRMVLEYKPGQGDAVKTALEGRGITVHRELKRFDSLALEMTKEQFVAMKDVSGIIGIYADTPREMLDTGSMGEISPFGIAQTQADQLNYAGGTKVCIIDSGYDYGHPDLPASAVTGEEDGLAGPWNQDGNGHGTHVAGTIAALGGNGEGVVGVNDDGNIQLHIVRVFDDEGGFAYASSLAGAISDCADAGANVISMSLGGALENPIEERAINQAARDGVLMIAAAGNDGVAWHSYPASYDAVMSVAAVDGGNNHASFSQRTAQVEIAAPGVSTLSTVPRGTGETGVGAVSQNGASFESIPMVGGTIGTVSAPLANCGIGDSACEDASGKICVIERGAISFGDKVANCEAGGGIGAIVYNNAPGIFGGDLGTTSDLVAVSLSQEDGEALEMDMEATISIEPMADYDYKSGTSMATPHVSGIAAKVWSHFPQCSANDIRLALRASAADLGEPGYDYNTGWGLVQTKAAFDYLAANGCKSPNNILRGGDGSAH
ncbi:S8 family serine peptidase [Microbulbifer sp. MCCC 1A16149]|uniref:S8 family serine peptidase n=1 Tax=Microbulbifer sp. MCCC 1A16149 TaxID=3411322 RepID=UPI003D09EA45